MSTRNEIRELCQIIFRKKALPKIKLEDYQSDVLRAFEKIAADLSAEEIKLINDQVSKWQDTLVSRFVVNQVWAVFNQSDKPKLSALPGSPLNNVNAASDSNSTTACAPPDDCVGSQVK